MDAYIEEAADGMVPDGKVIDAEIVSDIYDIEPNRKYEKKSLPRRMRYYHGLIDTQLLSNGIRYDKLQNVMIIVILPYDPFGKDRMVYIVQNQCVEDRSVPYEDGAKKIFLYTKGTKGNPSQELRDMLKYIETTTEENVTNQDIESVNKMVNRLKQKREVGINYMKSRRLLRSQTNWRRRKKPSCGFVMQRNGMRLIMMWSPYMNRYFKGKNLLQLFYAKQNRLPIIGFTARNQRFL